MRLVFALSTKSSKIFPEANGKRLEADTIKDLVKQINVEPTTLKNTIERYIARNIWKLDWLYLSLICVSGKGMINTWTCLDNWMRVIVQHVPCGTNNPDV